MTLSATLTSVFAEWRRALRHSLMAKCCYTNVDIDCAVQQKAKRGIQIEGRAMMDKGGNGKKVGVYSCGSSVALHVTLPLLGLALRTGKGSRRRSSTDHVLVHVLGIELVTAMDVDQRQD